MYQLNITIWNFILTLIYIYIYIYIYIFNLINIFINYYTEMIKKTYFIYYLLLNVLENYALYRLLI